MKLKNNIIVCEPQCAGLEHVEFNSPFLAALRSAYPEKKILFLAEKNHLENVRARLKEFSIEGIDFETIDIPQRNLLNNQRFSIELRLARSIFEKASTMNAEKIIFSSVTSAGLVSIKFLLRSFRDMDCMVILHAVLESVLKKRPPLKPFSLKSYLELPFWFRFTFPYGNNENLRYIVLGESIRDNLSRLFPRLRDRTVAIDHPYFYENAPDHSPFKDGIASFGSLGVASRSKGSDSFIRVAKEIKSGKEGPWNARFIHIGPVDKKIKFEGSCVELPRNDSFLSRADYERFLSAIDYAVFFHKPTLYRLTASGSLLDSFSHLKPVIALKNPFFSYYFDLMGDIGYLCDDYEDMKATILTIMKDQPSERYMKQRENILRGRDKLSVPEVGKKIRLWA